MEYEWMDEVVVSGNHVFRIQYRGAKNNNNE